MKALMLRDPIGDKVNLLDHGYVQAIEAWGCDERIIEAARMSTGKGFQGWGPKHEKECPWSGLRAGDYDTPCACDQPGDEKLLRYLYEHKHATPFEMAGMVIEVQAPIFVFREWHRHRTQSYNEMSARYTPLPDLNYQPTTERCTAVATGNKQAEAFNKSSAKSAEDISSWLHHVEQLYRWAEGVYREGLDIGAPKEIARIVLPVGRYSRMRASANLRNWLAFLTLRMDSAAQWEIRQYANEVGNVISQLYPRTWELFMEGREK